MTANSIGLNLSWILGNEWMRTSTEEAIKMFIIKQIDEFRVDESNKEEFKKGATFRCQSLYHNEDTVKANLSKAVLWIKAVPQDGIPECWNDEHELPTNQYKAYGIPGIILHYLLIWIPE